jgi:hypothetical protein
VVAQFMLRLLILEGKSEEPGPDQSLECSPWGSSKLRVKLPFWNSRTQGNHAVFVQERFPCLASVDSSISWLINVSPKFYSV